MRIYLGEMEFPAAPEKLEAEREGGWVKTELETLGEVLQYRPSRLKRVRFGGIFPGQRMGFVTAETLLAPSRYAEILEEAMNSREPRRLVVSGGAAPFSMLAAVESFSRREQAGEDARLQEQRELIQVVRNNLGVHQISLLRTLWPQRLAERLIGYIDLSRLNLRREEELGELLHILFGITAPALCAAAVGGDSGAVCARYRVQLDILKRGMAAPNPPAARGDESKE